MIGFGDIWTTWESYYESILDWTETVEEPYFLWVFLLEPHWPYRPPPRYRRHSLWSLYRTNWERAPASSTTPTKASTEILLDLYDGGIQHADELFGRLGADLPGNPAILVHADHGEEFGEHGNYGHGQLYEETIHVPFVIGNTDYSCSITSQISLSAMPNLVHSLAREEEAWFDIDSSFVIARKSDDQIAVRSQRWKYIDNDFSELYDLETDRNESENLVDEEQEIVKYLKMLSSRELGAIKEHQRISSAASTLIGGGEI